VMLAFSSAAIARIRTFRGRTSQGEPIVVRVEGGSTHDVVYPSFRANFKCNNGITESDTFYGLFDLDPEYKPLGFPLVRGGWGDQAGLGTNYVTSRGKIRGNAMSGFFRLNYENTSLVTGMEYSCKSGKIRFSARL
jgi:hypothetical protein